MSNWRNRDAGSNKPDSRKSKDTLFIITDRTLRPQWLFASLLGGALLIPNYAHAVCSVTISLVQPLQLGSVVMPANPSTYGEVTVQPNGSVTISSKDFSARRQNKRNSPVPPKAGKLLVVAQDLEPGSTIEIKAEPRHRRTLQKVQFDTGGDTKTLQLGSGAKDGTFEIAFGGTFRFQKGKTQYGINSSKIKVNASYSCP